MKKSESIPISKLLATGGEQGKQVGMIDVSAPEKGYRGYAGEKVGVWITSGSPQHGRG